jgi:isopentenyl-diphosphate Delta-isomerase
MSDIEQRKDDHIRISLEEDVGFDRLTTGLEQYAFVHQAVPEIDLAQVDTSTCFLGKRLRAPLLVSSMTGGTERAEAINHRLAEAAQERGLGMGLGSMRAALEDARLVGSFQVRRAAPDILLLANLGAVQLNYGYTVEHCQRAVDLVEADALLLHFNPLQEALQPEGQTNFAGLLNKVEQVCRVLEVPVVAKEVGWGFSERAARRLVDAGVAAIDVAGGGGTSWSQVEMFRSTSGLQRRVASTFRDWGISTANSIHMVRRAAPGIPLVASGGLVDGVDVAKVIGLGAQAAGMAAPFLKSAMQSADAVLELIDAVIAELQIAMFCIGAASIEELNCTSYLRLIGDDKDLICGEQN